MEPMRIIEAALFMSPDPISIRTLRRITGISKRKYIEELVSRLADEYKSKGSSIEIVKTEEGYLMRIKDDYTDYVSDLAPESEISKSGLRVLAYLSKHNGALKSQVVRRLGTHMYPAIKEVTEMGFVKQKKNGRSASLYLTDKFKRYFKTKV